MAYGATAGPGSGLCPGSRPEKLSADAPEDIEIPRRCAGAVLVLGDNLGDDPLRRHGDAHLATPGVVGHVTRGVPVSIETCRTCIAPPVAGRNRCGIKFPDIVRLIVVLFIAADRLAKLRDKRVRSFPDELVAKPRRRRRLLPRRRTAPNAAQTAMISRIRVLVVPRRADSFATGSREQGNFEPMAGQRAGVAGRASICDVDVCSDAIGGRRPRLRSAARPS